MTKQVKTEDGYTFTQLVDGTWSDGDLTYDTLDDLGVGHRIIELDGLKEYPIGWLYCPEFSRFTSSAFGPGFVYNHGLVQTSKEVQPKYWIEPDQEFQLGYCQAYHSDLLPVERAYWNTKYKIGDIATRTGGDTVYQIYCYENTQRTRTGTAAEEVVYGIKEKTT